MHGSVGQPPGRFGNDFDFDHVVIPLCSDDSSAVTFLSIDIHTELGAVKSFKGSRKIWQGRVDVEFEDGFISAPLLRFGTHQFTVSIFVNQLVESQINRHLLVVDGPCFRAEGGQSLVFDRAPLCCPGRLSSKPLASPLWSNWILQSRLVLVAMYTTWEPCQESFDLHRLAIHGDRRFILGTETFQIEHGGDRLSAVAHRGTVSLPRWFLG